MPSLLETAIRNHRAALLAGEAATLAEVIAAYAETRARLVKRINALADALERDGRLLTVSEVFQDARAKALLAQVEAEMAALALRMRTPIVAGQQAAVALASEQSLALVVVAVYEAVGESTAASVASSWNRLNVGAVEAMVGRLSNGSPLSEWINQFGPESAAKMRESLISATALGTNPRAVAAALSKQVDVAGARLLNFSRSTILDSYRSATLQTYAENADISTGEWEWISAQDDRTCLSCIHNDGQRFPLSQTFQQAHNNCRCSSMLVLEGIGAPERTLASEWFDQQSDATQRTMVPVTAFDDFNAGRLTLSDFSTLQKNETWGDRYRQSTVQEARAAASQRERIERRAA